MKEVIVFTSANQFSLLRQLAKYGVNTIGYRVLNNSNILSFIQERTRLLPSKKIINTKEKTYLYRRFLMEDSSYFKGSSYEDAVSLSRIIDSIRVLIEDNEKKEFLDKLTNDSLFKEKYEAIYNFYIKYIDYLNANNASDEIEEIRSLLKSNPKLDLEVMLVKGDEVSPLMRKLINNCFKSVKEIEYRDLYNVEKKNINFVNLYKSKGYNHEIANIFKLIAKEDLPLDKCTIVYTNFNHYYYSIKEYSSSLSLPVTFIDGIPALENNAYRMLYLITKLNDGLYGYDVLINLLKDKSFNYNKLIQDVGVTKQIDKYLETIGDLKFSFDVKRNEDIYSNYVKYNNDYKDEIERFKNIFNKGIISLIKEYVVIDNPVIINKLINDLELYESINNYDNFDFYKNILSANIQRTLAKAGTVSVCSIKSARENIRENMFFVGNDNDSFHISLAENCYISDDKLKEFNSKDADTSINKALKQIQQYKSLFQTAFDLDCNIYVSYTEKDETELKNHNFISLLYDLQKENDPNLTFDAFKNKFILLNTYFGNNLRKDEKIIETYLDKTKIIAPNTLNPEKENKIPDLLNKKYSPTQIEQNLNCKKRFLIENILKINQKKEYDVFSKFNIADMGNMFHEVMKFANQNKFKDQVINKANEVFDACCAKRNPILSFELENIREEFLELVDHGFEYISTKPQGIAESYQDTSVNVNGTKLLLKGIPDLLSGSEVIDYKTKKTVTHISNNTLSCIQALIYALMNSKNGIDHVEYYYPYFNRIIQATNNENDTIAQLAFFIDSITKTNFTSVIDENKLLKKDKKSTDICKFCSFKELCEVK